MTPVGVVVLVMDTKDNWAGLWLLFRRFRFRPKVSSAPNTVNTDAE